jgi:outer membrane receptor for ferrienterochelin and colicins
VDERQRWRSGQLYQFADNVQWGLRASAAVTAGAHRFAPTFYATEFDHLARRGAETEPPASGESERQRLLQASLVYATRMASVDLDAGIELRDESIRSDRVRGGALDIGSVGGYAQASMPFGTATIVPGIRVTTSRAWGAHVTPRVALLVRPLRDIALRASVGTGYRAPAFKELGMQFLNIGPGFGYAVRGNPDLRPETSFNVTGGVEWSGEHVYLRAQGFFNRLDDFIETQQTGDSAGVLLFTYDNIASGETRGVEFDAAATVGRGVRLEAGYARLIARGGDDEPLLGRPAHSGRLAWSYVRPSGLRLSLTSLHTGSTPVARDESGVLTRSAFTRFDARVAQSLPRGFEVAAGVDNVFDARPERWPGFAARQLHVSLAWNAGAR